MIDATEAKQVTSAASSLLFPEINFGVASNATYSREDWLEVLSRIAFDNEFANAGAKAYQCARGDDVSLETTARNPLVGRNQREDAQLLGVQAIHRATGLYRRGIRYLG